MKNLSLDKLSNLIDSLYNIALEGAPKAPNVFVLTENIKSDQNGDIEMSIEKIIKSHQIKNMSNGFLCGLGGSYFLALTLPAEISLSLYFQLRMILCIAHISGYDIKAEPVKSMVLSVLSEKSIFKLAEELKVQKQANLSDLIMKRLSSEDLSVVNKLLLTQLKKKLTKIGMKKFGKFVPVVGGAINAHYELQITKNTGALAKEYFYSAKETKI